MKIYHNSRKTEYRDPVGALHAGTSVLLSVDIADCDVRGIELEIWRDGEARSYIPMTGSMRHSGFGSEAHGCIFDNGHRYSAAFMLPEQASLFWYRFLIRIRQDGELRTVYYGNNESLTGGIGRSGYEGEIEPFQITSYKPSKAPSWYTDGIVYQIFPDRFARDAEWRERVTKANDYVNSRRGDIRRTIQEDWNASPYYVKDGAGNVIEWPMPGGSLKGIEERLDYLKSLGVSAIYLNPVFEATSNHRYDTGNYMKIDPALGSDEDFVSLAASAREKGIRIILDGVFSHTGADSIYFGKYGDYPGSEEYREDMNSGPVGGLYNEGSVFRSWFRFDSSQTCGYKSWWGVTDLPEVDENNESYREFILGDDGVAAHWMRMGASGWRLDVADELPDSFIEQTRRRVRSEDKEGLLIGEVWEDASNKISYNERRRYLLGDELDGCMNYPLRDILLDYVNYTISSGDAAERLASLEENYPPENFYASLNLIGSHDRERILTAMAVAEDYEPAVRKVKLLSTLQYALPGVPCIYYGDEAGLTGGVDPENRGCFPWGRENPDLSYHYRMLGLIYEEHPALKDGDFELLSGRYGISDDVFAFIRRGKDAAGNDETLLVLANRRYGETHVHLRDFECLRGGYALELLSSKEMPLDAAGSLGTVDMEKLSAMIISIRASRPEKEINGRDCGVICHISSLGIPTLGKPARDFVDFLSEAGFGIWQVLPLNPAGTGNSPYSSFAAFAGEPAFIDKSELPEADGLRSFLKNNAWWLDDYIAYMILKEANEGRPWYEWKDEQRLAESADVLASMTAEQKELADALAWEQYCFCVQWESLRKYANSKGIRIMGDLPIYMAADSADVWANQSIFRMDDEGRQRVHAGVPPDAFAEEGQDWGNPLYDWDELKRTGYEWWLRRMRQCAERYDILRIDHFRGLSEYYAIPEGSKPKTGLWQHGPGLAFFGAVHRMLKDEGLEMKLLAEDLGFLDSEVKNLLKLCGLPGMDIWQFSADEMKELCEKKPEEAALRAFYTGTHDNNTLMGWLEELKEKAMPDGDWFKAEEEETSPAETEREALEIISEIYESPAAIAMLQLQDVFLLGEDARMNVPGISEGNWKWKIPGKGIKEAFPDAAERAAFFRELAAKTGRL